MAEKVDITVYGDCVSGVLCKITVEAEFLVESYAEAQALIESWAEKGVVKGRNNTYHPWHRVRSIAVQERQAV